MAIQPGDAIKFAYVKGDRGLPEQPDETTIYILEQLQRIYVGSKLVASVSESGSNDYETLENLPQVNNVTLIGNKSLDELGIKNILCDTTTNWNQQATLQSVEGWIYVYTDHQKLGDQNIPGMKIGDGNAYLIDLPFTDAVYASHIADKIIHITQEERDKWNNKVTCYIDPSHDKKLIFSKE